MKTKPTRLPTLPLMREAIKPNHDLRKQGERIARLSLNQEITGGFSQISMIEDAMREMNAAYMKLWRGYTRAVEMERAQNALGSNSDNRA